MTVPRRAALALAVAALVPAAVAHPARPAVADDAIPGARARAAAIRAQISVLRGRLARVAAGAEVAYARLGESTVDTVVAERAADAATDAGRAARETHAARVRALYARGGTVVLYASLLDARDPADVVTRYRAVESVLGEDASAERAAAGRAAVSGRVARERAGEVQNRVVLERQARALADEAQWLLAQQQALLATADAQVARLLAQERQRDVRAALDGATRTRAGAAGYVPRADLRYACPVGPAHSFIDTWGAPRAGGRRHEGTDVFAPYAAQVYAVVDGVVDRVGDDGGRGGLRVWVRADNGDAFYYAHNSENLVQRGQRVRAGQLIAHVGTSGDAAGTPPHVHFETHPQGGAAVDSYPFLRAVCG